jgi:hypothetical protein
MTLGDRDPIILASVTPLQHTRTLHGIQVWKLKPEYSFYGLTTSAVYYALGSFLC